MQRRRATASGAGRDHRTLKVQRDEAFNLAHVAVVYLGPITETGKTNEVFGRTEHPYTEALISAIPLPDPAAQPISSQGLRFLNPMPHFYSLPVISHDVSLAMLAKMNPSALQPSRRHGRKVIAWTKPEDMPAFGRVP